MDKDKDGKIHLAELNLALQARHLTLIETEVASLFDIVDTDEDEQLRYVPSFLDILP